MPALRATAKTAITFIQRLFNICRSIAYVLIFSNLHPELFRFKVKDPYCVILGNGPSLKETLDKHMSFLNGKKTFCTNDFTDSPYFSKIKPSYYIFTDPAFWSNNLSEKFKVTFERYRMIMETQVTWPMIIFFPTTAQKTNFCRDLPVKNRNIHICYINTTEVDCVTPLRYWLYRKNLAIPPMQNVLVAGIFVAINLGFKTIYVTGADHSWHESFYVSENNVLYLKNTRFQDKEVMHLSPFFEDAAEMRPYKMHNLYAALSRMFKGYLELEEYSQKVESKIYNASEKSYIDAFERYKIK